MRKNKKGTPPDPDWRMEDWLHTQWASELAARASEMELSTDLDLADALEIAQHVVDTFDVPAGHAQRLYEYVREEYAYRGRQKRPGAAPGGRQPNSPLHRYAQKVRADELRMRIAAVKAQMAATTGHRPTDRAAMLRVADELWPEDKEVETPETLYQRVRGLLAAGS